MSLAVHSSKALFAFFLVGVLGGCEEEAAKEPAAAAKPSAAMPSPEPVSAPAPSVAPPPKLRDDCPEGSSGEGTQSEPCLGSGDSRMMEVKYTGKTTDEGPKFSVTNKTKKSILFGSIAVYFYDKAGKQLEVPAEPKPRPKQTCAGNIFAGAVKPDEKIFVYFSCVKQDTPPEGTVTIEAELKTVGFADESGEKNEFYWSNPDLAPNERPKGGIKPAKAKKK
jgi:hypothetical protein